MSGLARENYLDVGWIPLKPDLIIMYLLFVILAQAGYLNDMECSMCRGSTDFFVFFQLLHSMLSEYYSVGTVVAAAGTPADRLMVVVSGSIWCERRRQGKEVIWKGRGTAFSS